MTDIQIVPESDFEQKRIGILCLPGLETFIKPIAVHFEENYAVRTCYSNSMAELESVIDWADLVFLEWANELAIHVTNNIDVKDKKVLIRLHSYEALSGYCAQIKWEEVDGLILVAQHIKDLLPKQQINLPKDLRTYIIPNGVNIKKFRRLTNEG